MQHVQCPDANVLAEFVRGESGDPAAIAEHLDHCGECSSVVGALLKAARPESPVARDDPAPPIVRGASVGRYLVVDLVGAGGMGVVYSAYDPQLDRKVALKLLWASGGRVLEQPRLLREAQALARVSHPNIMAVYDVGLYGNRVFVVMEHVQGETLGRWLRARERSTSDVLAAFIAAGQGLAAVHNAGVVHGDFKPDNVLIGADGRVRVTDFGLARMAEGEPGPPENPALAGTPAYMAPEQLQGRPIDARTDQFSFCIALFEALHGHRPFADANRDRAAPASPEPVEPPTSLGPGRQVPRWLRHVLRRGLSSESGERFPSMHAVVAALRQDKRAARRRILMGAAGVALAAFAVVGARETVVRHHQVCRGAAVRLAGVWDAGRKAAARSALQATGVPYAARAFATTARILDDYTRRWVAARTDACEATRLRGEQSEELLDRRVACLDARLGEVRALVDVLVHADARTAEHAVGSARSLGDLEACASAAVLAMPADPDQRQRVQQLRRQLARAQALRNAVQAEAGLKVAAQVVTEAQAVGWRPLEAEALFRLADLQELGGRFHEAEQTFRQAILAAEWGRHDTVAADAWIHLVFVIGTRLARPAEGLALAEQAAAAVGRLGHDEQRRAKLLHGLAAIYLTLGRPDQAEKVGRKALAIREKELGPEDIEVSNSLVNLGIALSELGRFDESLACYRRALAIREKEYGPEHPSVAIVLENLGATLRRRGEPQSALAYIERARRAFEKSFGAGHPRVIDALIDEGDVLLAEGRCKEALARDLRAATLAEKALGPSHPTVASALTQAGEAHISCGEAGAARVLLERAVAIRVAAGRQPASLGRTRFALAKALWERERSRGRARSLARAALDDYRQAGKPAAKERSGLEQWMAAHR